MFEGYIHTYLPQAFGITVSPIDRFASLQAGKIYKIKDENDKVLEQVVIRSYWVAEMRAFMDFTTLGSLVVSIISSNSWTKGVLLIPDPTNKSTKALIKPPIAVNWEDPVATTLKQISFFSDTGSEGKMGGAVKGFSLQFGTNLSQGILKVDDITNKTPDFQRLYSALLKVVHHFVEEYDDDKVTEFISRTI